MVSDRRKRLELILVGLEAQGATIRPTRNGYQVCCPDGALVTTHLTPTDYRAEKNFRALLRRHGLQWPLD